MSDEYDVFTEAEIEDELLRRFEARQRLVDALLLEVGFRAIINSSTMQRDLRWFRGLFGMRIG